MCTVLVDYLKWCANPVALKKLIVLVTFLKVFTTIVQEFRTDLIFILAIFLTVELKTQLSI